MKSGQIKKINYWRYGKKMLPRMTTGNWIFWGIMVWIGVNLIWIGLFPALPAWIGTIIATGLAAVTIKFGPRPIEEEHEEEVE